MILTEDGLLVNILLSIIFHNNIIVIKVILILVAHYSG